jgi:hypothetical protein
VPIVFVTVPAIPVTFAPRFNATVTSSSIREGRGNDDADGNRLCINVTGKNYMAAVD